MGSRQGGAVGRHHSTSRSWRDATGRHRNHASRSPKHRRRAGPSGFQRDLKSWTGASTATLSAGAPGTADPARLQTSCKAVLIFCFNLTEWKRPGDSGLFEFSKMHDGVAAIPYSKVL